MKNLAKSILIFLFIPMVVMAQTSPMNVHQIVLNLPVKMVKGKIQPALVTTMITFASTPNVYSQNTNMVTNMISSVVGNYLMGCSSAYGLNINKLNQCSKKIVNDAMGVLPNNIVIYDIKVLSTKSY